MDVTEAPELITTAEAAEILGVDRSGIIRRMKSGQLTPAQTLPGRTGSHLFSRADVLALSSSADRPQVGGGAPFPGDVTDPVAGGTSDAA